MLFDLPPAEPVAKPTYADPKARGAIARGESGAAGLGTNRHGRAVAGGPSGAGNLCVHQRMDLAALCIPIEARDEVAVAPAIDPKILLGLWVYSTSEGEGSAREIWRLTEVHAAYRWICGGVDVGYHTLSDFRSERGAVVDALITLVLALPMKQNLVDLNRVAQDGTRVRASAGAASFRREETLQALMEEARTSKGSDRGGGGSQPQRAAGGGAKAWSPAAHRSPGGGSGADTRSDRDQEAQWCQRQHRACLDHRSRRAGDEDGRRRVSTSIQRAIRNDSRQGASHRRRRGVKPRQ